MNPSAHNDQFRSMDNCDYQPAPTQSTTASILQPPTSDRATNNDGETSNARIPTPTRDTEKIREARLTPLPTPLSTLLTEPVTDHSHNNNDDIAPDELREVFYNPAFRKFFIKEFRMTYPLGNLISVHNYIIS